MNEPGDADLEAWLEFSNDLPSESQASHPRWLRWSVFGAVAATALGLVLMWPGRVVVDRTALNVIGIPGSLDSARVVDVTDGPCPYAAELDCATVDFLLETGPDDGTTYRQVFPSDDISPEFTVGKRAVLARRDPEGTVIDGRQQPCSFDSAVDCRVLRLRLNDEAGTVVEAEVSADNIAYGSFAGDELHLELFEESGGYVVLGVSIPTVETTYQFADFQRRPLLFWVFLLFAAVVVLIGRWQGMLALGGLAVSLTIVLLFVVRGVVAGGSPLPIAVVGAAAITIVTLYMAHGTHAETSVALLGVLGAIVLTAVLGAVTLSLANVTGFSSEEATFLTLFDGIEVRGLLLAGVVLGAAGTLDDVAITQAAAVRELRAANPTLGRRQLFERAMRIGRDHIASTVNTLLLAYAGASLPLLVLFVLTQQSLGSVVNSEVVAVEALRTLVGSLGLLATVPFTTWLASMAVEVPSD